MRLKISSSFSIRFFFSSGLNEESTRSTTCFEVAGLSIHILNLQKSFVHNFSIILFNPLCHAGLHQNFNAILAVTKSISS
jgi:hypothetical protein